MARSLPERTVDAYLAIALAARFPRAAIWNPTNTAGSWDTTLDVGKTVLFESKGNEQGANAIAINRVQLDDYLNQWYSPLVFYLLPDPGAAPRPWHVPRAALAPGAAGLQWLEFPRWSYVVSALALGRYLGRYLGRAPAPAQGRSIPLLPGGGGQFSIGGAAPLRGCRLDRFLNWLAKCFWVNTYSSPLSPGSPPTAGQAPPGWGDLSPGTIADLSPAEAAALRYLSDGRTPRQSLLVLVLDSLNE